MVPGFAEMAPAFRILAAVPYRTSERYPARPAQPAVSCSILPGGIFQHMLLTCPRTAPILIGARRPTLRPESPSSRREIRIPRGWAPLANPDVKEWGVGAERDDTFAARRAEMERFFQSLPAAGTPAYWQRIEQATAETALPLEVLARCIRERIEAGKRQQAERVYAVILGRIQTSVQRQMQITARALSSGQKNQLAQDLEQECYTALWEELIDPEPTFFCEHFVYALKRLMSHAEHSVMGKGGFWKRPGVRTPKRVPVQTQVSIEAPISPNNETPLGETLPDVKAPGAFEDAETEADIAALLASLKPEDRELIKGLFWSDLTQEQVAERLHITDRTVRNRLDRILKRLRREYLGGEEDERG
jgi:RNA polymerase sigma factor (sigma-70 family)